jgi:predicted transcriptional regulator
MATRPSPFSLRLSPGLDARISALARQTNRSKASILESLADEAERCRRYPGLAFRGRESARRAWIIGAGLDVWEIVRALQDFGDDVDRMVRESRLSNQQVQLAGAYYREFTEEIDLAIAADRRPLDQLQSEYPFIRSLIVEA